MSMEKTEDIYNNLKGMVENLIGLDISHGKKIKYEDLGDYINRVFMIVGANGTEELRKRLITDLEYEYNITHTVGAAIFDVYDKIGDWYNNAEITDTYFWSRYKHYLTNHSSLDLKSINLLDEKTLPEIMNCLGDPKLKPEGKKLRRGLIIGDVQSGKTATYIGVRQPMQGIVSPFCLLERQKVCVNKHNHALMKESSACLPAKTVKQKKRLKLVSALITKSRKRPRILLVPTTS